MLKKIKCSHCVRLFQPIRMGHRFCSDTCRKLQFKVKKRAESTKRSNKRLGEKLIKLSGSAFGRYLVREIRRAGTVQILNGHTFDSLNELASLRRKCTASSGYEHGEALGTYELSHIYPAGGSRAKNVGLLHPANLVITPKEFNRKHSTKLPSCGYQGRFINRNNLDVKWQVKDGDESIEVLKLARKFIGDDFDKWLKGHLVTYTQKQALVKLLKVAGLPADMLKAMSLRALKALAAEEELPYFDLSKSPADIRDILSEEILRLNLGPEFAKGLELLADYDWSLGSPMMEFIGTESERRDFEKFLVEQTLACLHGQPFVDKWRKKSVLMHFKEHEVPPYVPYISDGYDDIL